jgi:hypothetical protein
LLNESFSNAERCKVGGSQLTAADRRLPFARRRIYRGWFMTFEHLVEISPRTAAAGEIKATN